MHGLAQATGGAVPCGAVPAAADAGEEPFGIFVAGVELAQASEELGGDGNFAGLAVFSVGDVDDEALAVDVAGLDGEGFAQAQSALIDDGAEGSVAAVAEGAQEQGDLIAGEDVGQRLFALDADFFPDVPMQAEVVTVKGAQPADGLVEGGRGEFAVVLEVDEEVEHARRGECGEIFVREVTVELEDPAMVAVAAALGEAFKLDEAGEVLIPRSRCECGYLFFISVIRLTARVTPFNVESRNRRLRLCSTRRHTTIRYPLRV